MPTLNQTRKFTNGCFLDGIIYVVGGTRGLDLQVLGSIETFNVNLPHAKWLLIELNQPNPLLRGYCAVVSLNHNEIAILGGADQAGNDLSDVVLYNIKSRTCTVVSNEGPFLMWHGKTQTAYTALNTVVCLVEPTVLKDVRLCLIQYKLSDPSFTVLKYVN